LEGNAGSGKAQLVAKVSNPEGRGENRGIGLSFSYADVHSPFDDDGTAALHCRRKKTHVSI